MPSPFPGMDPWIESQVWEDCQTRLITELSNVLVPRVRPRYVVRVEQRVYVEHSSEGRSRSIWPDVALMDRGQRGRSAPGDGPVTTAVAQRPVLLALPMPEPRREAYLSVRLRQAGEVVTLIEVLSPANKRPAGDGRREYLAKRDVILESSTHLVELDLLRGGERLPMLDPLPAADYYAFVCRVQDRPLAAVYAWSLREALPTIPIPLAGDDPDVTLDLQALFTTVYDRAGYDYSLDYRLPVEPPLSDEDAAWARRILEHTKAAG